MKKSKLVYCFYLTFILLSASITSCQDSETFDNSNTGESEVQLRSLSIDDPSVSNPTLHTDWQNVSTIYLNGGGVVDAPWVNREGNSMNIPLNYRLDIKKEDGWIMLSHTLINKTSSEPNYILLYNSKTGILKGFYYNNAPQKNNSFLWVIESSTLTSVLPSNLITQGSLNSTYKYATTSNIVESSDFDFGQLNPGWNAFSFELIYGTVNNNPVISIKGYNDEKATIKLAGTYSGEVIIPVAGGDNGFKSIVSALKNMAGITANFVPVVSSVEKGLSVASTVFGYTSLFKSAQTTMRATSSGKINLEGNSFTTLGGAVYSLNNITLKRLNGNTDLGLWTLSKNPEYNYNKYNRAYVDNKANYTSNVKMTIKEDLSSLIVINPAIQNSIASYQILSTQFFSTSKNKQYETTEIVKNSTYNVSTTAIGRSFEIIPSPGDNYAFVLDHTHRGGVLLNITIEFTYKDGSKFISSRNFQPNFIKNNNDSFLNTIKGYDRVVILDN